MRYLISSIFTIFILSIPSVVFGYLDDVKDVGVICKWDDKGEEVIPKYISIWFLGNEKMEFYHRDKYDFDKDGDRIEFVDDFDRRLRTTYLTKEDKIVFSHYGDKDKFEYYSELNRFTLEMEGPIGLGPKWRYFCDFYPTKEQFNKGMKDIEKMFEKLLGERKI